MIEQGVEPGNTIASSARQEGRILDVTWDAFVSRGDLLMTIPDEVIFALAEYCIIDEIEGIVNKQQRIPLFHGHYRYESLAFFRRQCRP